MRLPVKQIAKVVISIASVGVNLAAEWYNNKKLDEKVAEKVAEALGKAKKGS